jgi:tetratricopeptide (TPR) repeat protein
MIASTFCRVLCRAAIAALLVSSIAALLSAAAVSAGQDSSGRGSVTELPPGKPAKADSAAKAGDGHSHDSHSHDGHSHDGHSHSDESTHSHDSAPGQESAPESPEARRARLQESDTKTVEFEAKQRKTGQSADSREKAIDGLLAQVEKSPRNFDLRFKLANAYHEGGYPFSALAQYTEAARIDSTHSKTWVNRGVLLKELGRIDDAELSFRRAIAINADDALAHINLGDMLLTQKKYQEAVDSYRRALTLEPSSPNAYYSLAISFAEAGMYRDAARAWRKSAELSQARGAPQDKDNADRALENAKLMDDIVAEAAENLKAREAKQHELEQTGAKGEGKEGTSVVPPDPGSKGKEPESKSKGAGGG